MNTKPAVAKRVKKKIGVEGIAHVRATYNNTIVNITDSEGNVICWGSPGKAGFKGSRKSTPFAAQIATESVGKAAYDAGIPGCRQWSRGRHPGDSQCRYPHYIN
jgi:small subunit ribosomal protein S11